MSGALYKFDLIKNVSSCLYIGVHFIQLDIGLGSFITIFTCHEVFRGSIALSAHNSRGDMRLVVLWAVFSKPQVGEFCDKVLKKRTRRDISKCRYTRAMNMD